MLQFYFLSILLNSLAGLIFVYSQKKEFSDFGGDSSITGGDIDSPDGSAQDPLSADALSDGDSDGDHSGKSAAGGILALSFLDDGAFRLVVGILSGLVGVLKLLSPIQYDIPIVGDLIPAVAGISACGSLLIEYYQNNSDIEIHLPEPITVFFTEGRRYLGIFCLIAGVLHFIFPRVLFL